MISKGNATRIEYKSAKFVTFTLTDFSDPLRVRVRVRVRPLVRKRATIKG